ncbi:STT3 domain-containing protein [Hippea maritima]|uniref:Oligosaccharyl transferase STT3 subunit n=1 Tax=Hippea maritima (strain ATCC 700847 / DSM 10411 / MH2) TaxID=760142 RepID=F2LTU3_HIPMA|nr:STT3 domain-containing protein [Hippea maritima]AEA34469.1 Oligosaccharyl transferase STT3 subunit [Hippea maritima DSM 10411]
MKQTSYFNFKLFLIFVLLVFSASFYFRYHQFSVWKTKPDVYFVKDYPAMTTLDAYYWLRYAKEYKNGSYYKSDNDTLRAYPEFTKKAKPIPLISFLIAWFSKITGMSIYLSGLMLVPILASLFVIPFALLFYEAKMPIAGLVGGFVGAFSWMYAIRTAMGRVDTDLLQLFFMFLGSYFVVKASLAEDRKRMYLYALLLGLNFLLFGWWYAHYGIDLVYFVVLIAFLIFRRVNLKDITVVCLLFIFFSNPLWFFSSLNSVIGFFTQYGKISSAAGGDFPNILKTITEAEHVAAAKVLSYILSSPVIDTLGLILSLFALVFARFYGVAVLPVFLLGMLAFRSSNRTVMFLAPFVGIGFGFLFDFILNRLKSDKFNSTLKNVISSLVVVVLVVGLGSFSAYKFVPRPSIAAPIVDSFLDLKDELDKAVIFSWWDYGYAIEDIDGFATYHDGGAHGGARTYLVAKALISDNQTLMHNIISFMNHYGVKPIMDNITKDNVSAGDAVKMAFGFNKPLKDNNNYVLFTQDMIGKYYAISYLGSWDFKKEKSYPDGYSFFACFGYKNGVFKCNRGDIDTKTGVIDGKLPIKRLVYVINGRIADEKTFNSRGVNVEICMNRIDKKVVVRFVLVCDDRVFESNFNKMYILGDYDSGLFEEVYNKFPTARVFRVK